MTEREALKLALEALKTIDEAMPFPVAKLAQAAIKEALAQPEPVALEAVYETIIQWDEGGGKQSRRELARRIVSLYHTLPQRKPLTDEEIGAILEGVNAYGTRLYTFARAIEAKLRAKNAE